MKKFSNQMGTSCVNSLPLFKAQNLIFTWSVGKKLAKIAFLPLVAILFTFSSLLAQDPIPPKGDVLFELQPKGAGECPADPCPCEGGYTAIKTYYFGEDNVTIEVYGNASLTTLITSFAGVNKGDLLTINGNLPPFGILYSRTYLKVTNALNEVCVTKLHSRCPTNSWPGALDDLRIVGKTFGDFTIFSVTDQENNNECTISDVDQDWHVGGNVVEASNNTMGTRNNEDVTFISNDTPRGVITRDGDYGINTLAPAATLHVQGDQIIEETLDVNGIARMNDVTSSTSPTDGALIVAGGTGIGDNLNVGTDAEIGNDLNVGNNADIGVDLTVGNNADIGTNLLVGQDATINQDLSVLNNGYIEGSLGIGINPPDVKVHAVGNRLRLSTPGDLTRLIELRTDGTDTDLNAQGADLYIRSIGHDVIMNPFTGDGKVAIGTTSVPDFFNATGEAYKLYVAGGILSEEVRVKIMPWPDYVFGKNYTLFSLEEVENFIQKNGHLHNTPSATEVETDGLPLGESAVNQQEKIEEIFLHLIEMNKQLKALKSENEMLKAELIQIKNK